MTNVTTEPLELSPDLEKFILYLADSNFIMSHRLQEWCGHGPYLEEDISLSNIALNLLGHARLFYEWVAEQREVDEDSLAFTREEREYCNLLLVELPNGDYAQTMLKLYLFTLFSLELFKRLKANDHQSSNHQRLRDIAEKASLEVADHLNHSEHWVKIFAHSTEAAHSRLQNALDLIAPYIMEAYQTSDFEQQVIETDSLNIAIESTCCTQPLTNLLQHSKIKIPAFEEAYSQSGGKNGVHTEHMGYLLADIQHINLKYPNSKW